MVELIPSPDAVMQMLKRTGAFREGHFVYPNGKHSPHYFQMPLAFRYYDTARVLAVALSRKFRLERDISSQLPKIAIISPSSGGIPVAFGVREALSAEQIYWAERQPEGAMQFRQFMEVHHAEKIILVDDILRNGRMLKEMVQLFKERGATVLALGVVVYQPNVDMADFGSLPIYSLARLNFTYYPDAASCELCRKGLPVVTVSA